jgi:hypothetical protein
MFIYFLPTLLYGELRTLKVAPDGSDRRTQEVKNELEPALRTLLLLWGLVCQIISVCAITKSSVLYAHVLILRFNLLFQAVFPDSTKPNMHRNMHVRGSRTPSCMTSTLMLHSSSRLK